MKKGDRVRVVRTPGIPGHENLEFGDAIMCGATGVVDRVDGDRIYFLIDPYMHGDVHGYKRLVLPRNTMLNNIEFIRG